MFRQRNIVIDLDGAYFLSHLEERRTGFHPFLHLLRGADVFQVFVAELATLSLLLVAVAGLVPTFVVGLDEIKLGNGTRMLPCPAL